MNKSNFIDHENYRIFEIKITGLNMANNSIGIVCLAKIRDIESEHCSLTTFMTNSSKVWLKHNIFFYRLENKIDF